LIRDAAKYALEREQFGQKIAEFQLIQAMLADSKTESYAARCMVLDAAKKRDAGENVTMEAACAKYYASEMVGRVADRAVQIANFRRRWLCHRLRRRAFLSRRAHLPHL
jgi:acyl-CoA dehydrogenase